MPSKGDPLSADRLLKRWIDAGANWPTQLHPLAAKPGRRWSSLTDRQHWSFLPLNRPAPPAKDDSSARRSIVSSWPGRKANWRSLDARKLVRRFVSTSLACRQRRTRSTRFWRRRRATPLAVDHSSMNCWRPITAGAGRGVGASCATPTAMARKATPAAHLIITATPSSPVQRGMPFGAFRAGSWPATAGAKQRAPSPPPASSAGTPPRCPPTSWKKSECANASTNWTT